MDAALGGVFVFAGMALGGSVATGAVGLWALNLRRSLGQQLQEESQATRMVERLAGELEARVASRDAELAHAQEQMSELRRDASHSAARSDELQIQVVGQRDEAERREEKVRALEKRLGTAEQAREAARRELSSVQGQVNRMNASLASLGVVIPDTSWAPTDPARRGASRESLQALLVDTSATAAALVDRQGLVTFAAGADEIIDRLGVAAALFGSFEPAFGALLCASVLEVSILTRRGSTHLMVVPGTPLIVALENQGSAPRHAATRARLELFGRPSPASPIVEMSAFIPETSREPDPDVERMLRSWAERWGVEQVGLLDAAGQVIGSTSTEVSGPMLGLRRALGPTLARFVRDGWALDDVEIRARSEGVAITVRPIDSHGESPVLVAMGPKLPETWALEELAATVRWHIGPMNTSSAVRRTP